MESNSLLREIARSQTGIEKRIKRLERMRRFSNASIEGNNIIIYDEDGNIRVIIGVQDDGSITIVDQNGAPPPQPSLPSVGGLTGAISVSWDGLTASGEPWPADFRRVEVHMSPTENFTDGVDSDNPLGNATHAASFVSARGGVVTIPSAPGVLKYVTLVAENTSGVNGAPTAEIATAALAGMVEPVEPPAESPDIEAFGMPNSIVIRAENVHASSLITYQVTADDPNDPGATWEDLPACPTRATVYAARGVPSVGPFEVDEVYYFRTIASNAAGEAQPSDPVSASLDLTAVADLIAETFTAETIWSGKIFIGQGRWTADEGIVIPQPDDGVIHLPVDGTAAQITAEFVARSLIVENGADLFGTSNLAGILRMASSVNDPSTAPVLAADYESVQLELIDGTTDTFGLCRTIEDDGWVTVQVGWPPLGRTHGFTTLVKHNESGAIVDSMSIGNATGDIGGVVAVGSRYYVLKRGYADRANPTTGWCIQPYTAALEPQTTWPSLLTVSGPMTIGTDGTDLLLAWMNPDNTAVKVAVVDAPASGTGSVLSNNTTFDDANMSSNLGGIYFGSADFGADRWVIHPRNGDVRVYNTTPSSGHDGTRVSGSEWPRPVGNRVYGLTWDGSHFWCINSDGLIRRLAGHGLGGTHYWAYRWEDDDTHRTGLSPRKAWARPARSLVKITCGKAPQQGEVGDHVADRIRVFASATAAGSAYPQGSALTVGAKIATVETITLSGTAAGTNNFAAVSNAGVTEATEGGWWVDGSSNGSIGDAGFHDDVMSKVVAYWAARPHSERKATTQSIAHATSTAVQWPTLVTERGGFTPTVSNSKWTVPSGEDGTYECDTTVSFDGDGDGRRVVEIHVNGAIAFSDSRATIGPSTPVNVNVHGTFDLAAGDTVEVIAYHNADNSLDISNASRVTVRRKP